MEQKIETCGPAFPVQYSNEADGPTVMPHVGMTLRQYAAIKLRVPNSGTDWLDEMIRESLRDELAAKGMPDCYAEYCAHANVRGYEEQWQIGIAMDSYAMADAMLKARDRGTGESENDRHVAIFLLREALKSCLEYGAMTGADWVTDKARAALASTGEPQ